MQYVPTTTSDVVNAMMIIRYSNCVIVTRVELTERIFSAYCPVNVFDVKYH